MSEDHSPRTVHVSNKVAYQQIPISEGPLARRKLQHNSIQSHQIMPEVPSGEKCSEGCQYQINNLKTGDISRLTQKVEILESSIKGIYEELDHFKQYLEAREGGRSRKTKRANKKNKKSRTRR